MKESTRAVLVENQLPPAQKAAAIRARQVYTFSRLVSTHYTTVQNIDFLNR